MHTLRFFVLTLIGLLAISRVAAEHQSDPVTVPVDVVAEFTTDSSPSEWDPGYFYVSGAGIARDEIWYETSETLEYRNELKPGKAYYFYVYGYHIDNYKIRIHAPTGYTVYMDDVDRKRMDGSGDRTIKVRVSADGESPAGVAPEPRPGRVLWSVGVGQLKNGDPAGAIQMRESSINANCFKPAALYFDSDNPDVRVVYSSGILRQVYANECLADIVAINTYSYWIRFYSRSQVGSQNGDGTWQVGAPFVTYKVENPVYPTVNRLKITRTDTIDGTRTAWSEIRLSGSTWTVYPWNTGTYPAVPDSQSTVTYSNSNKNETIAVKNASGTTIAQSFNEYKDYTWGRELYRAVLGYNDTNPLESVLDYHTTSYQVGNYKQVKSRIGPDGNWERYDYYDDADRRGQIMRTYRPFGNAPSVPTSATTTNCEVTEIDYAADFTGQRTLPSSIVTRRSGVVCAQSLISYSNDSENRNGLPIVVATRDDYASAGSYSRTVTRSYRGDAVSFTSVPNAAFLAGRPHSVVRPDGTMTAYVYLWGVYNPSNRAFVPVSGGTEFLILSIEGTQSSSGNSALGTYAGYAIDGGSAPNFYVIPNRSTASGTVYSSSGVPIWTQSEIYTSSGWEIVSREITAYVQGLAAYPSWKSADSGNPYVNMETFSADYNDGNLLSWMKDASGVETYYMHDSLGRRYGSLVSRVDGHPVTAPAGYDETWSLVQYDAASRVTKSWTANAFNYPTHASTDIVSTTNYDWAGRVTSATIPGVVGETVSTYTTTNTYFYGGNPRATRVVGPDGSDVIKTTYLDGRPLSVTGSGTTPQYFTYWVDSDGKLCTVKSLTSTWSGDGWIAVRTDWLGRSVWTSGPTHSGYFNTTDEFNSSGQLITRESYNGSWSRLLAPMRYRYDANGQSDRSGMDVSQNGSLDDTGLDRVTLTSDRFVSMDGAWWVESTSKALTNTANATDGVAASTYTRLTGIYASQTDGSRLVSETRTVDANGQTSTAKTYVDRGTRKTTVATSVPGSTTSGGSVSINGLTATITSTTGAATQKTYDGYRRPLRTTTRDSVYVELEYYPGTTLVKHKKNLNLGGTGFQQTYYDSAGRVSVDRIYDSTQWKTNRFAYTSRGELWRQWGSGQSPIEYEYNSYGWRTKMRAYRTTGVNWDSVAWPGSGQPYDETMWGYHGPTGLVVSKTDPKGGVVSFTFNDRGQVATRTWARGVVTTYLYEDSAAYQTGDLWQVTYSDGTPSLGYSRNLGGTYTMRHGQPEAIFDGAGGRVIWYRLNDLQVTHEYLDQSFYGNSSGQYRTLVRTYDSLGRLGTYDTRWSSSGSANFQSVTYRYDSVTGRVDRVTGTRVGVSTRTFDYQYRPNSDLVSAVIGADSGSGFRRDIYHQTWRELVDTVATTWSSADRARFVYDHDSAAKRTGQRINGDVAVALGYGSEIQNWYHFTQRGEIDWTEAIRNDNGTSISDRYRDWYYDSQGNRDGEYNQSGHKDFEPWTANEYRSIAGIQRTYDADGNLTNDGVWWYYWDGENRLKTAQKQDWSKRLEFGYDFQGRRVRKVVKNGDINAAVASDRRYIYDGWNIVAEIDALNTGAAMQVVKTFTWGLDVTNTVHGGGGVGGLLAIHGNSDCLLPLYDANGNVHGLIDGYSGTMKAAYAFTAFGETLQAINLNGGSAASDNPIRFASKWLDVESGLYDYNCRVYSPMEGRFISRDPMQENGGLNLYAYCGNDPSTHWDYIGQSWLSKAFKKIGNWFKKNWTSIVGAVLNFVPGVGPMLSMAWNAAIGYKYGGIKGLALGIAGSLVGGKVGFGKDAIGLNLGGRLAGGLSRTFNLGSFSSTVVNGYVTGGISGGTSATLSGRNFLDGFKAGATTGAVLAGGGWAWQNRAAIGESLRGLSDSVSAKIRGMSAALAWRSDPYPGAHCQILPAEYEFDVPWDGRVDASPDPSAYLDAAGRASIIAWQQKYGHLFVQKPAVFGKLFPTKPIVPRSREIFVGVEGEWANVFGADGSAGVMYNIDDPGKSGIFWGGGPAAGETVGGAAMAGYAHRGVGGEAVNLDVNYEAASLTLGFDDQGLNSAALSVGPGGGAAISYTQTDTYTLYDLQRNVYNVVFTGRP